MSPRRLELSDALRRDWDRLADRLSAGPFLRPGWILPWWKAFGAGRLELLELRWGRSLEGVLPIARLRGAIRSPTNWHTPEFGPLCADGNADALLRQLFTQRSRSVELGWLTAPADLDSLKSVASAAGYAYLVRTRERSPTINLDGDWSSFEQSLSGNLRRDLRRRRRRLEELGALTFDISDSPSSLPDAFALERLGWKGFRRTAMSSQAHTARFYGEIARWAAQRGWLRLTFLRLDRRPLAFHFALEVNGAYYALKGGFDPAFASYSPGALMIHATLQRAFAAGLYRYELLGDDAWYKRRWTNETRGKWLFQAFAPTPLGGLNRTAVAYGRPLTKALLASIGQARDASLARSSRKVSGSALSDQR